MDFGLFFQPFLVSLVLSIGFVLLFSLAPFFQKKKWRDDTRHAGKRNISRLGGVAMLLSFIITVLFDPHLVISEQILGFLIGCALVLLFGMWDDFSELVWKIQIFFQTALAVLLFIFGVKVTSVTNPFGGAFIFPEENVLLGFLILFVWLLLVMNAMNWLDGLDGLSGGVSLITLLTIFFLSLKPEVNQPPIALLSIIGVGTTLGFLFFNIHPARILAGTVGSMFLGFFIAVLAVIAGTKIATALLVLSLPIIDALWVIFERLREGKSIFQADRRHLHYQLRELGWSERKIAWFFSSITGLIALVALNTASLGKFIALFLALGIILAFVVFISHKTRVLRASS